jgi:cobalt transporter subunit CbtA
MHIFRSIVFSAALSGLIVGLVVTLAQQFGTVPLIQQAEVFEKAGEAMEAAAPAHEHATGVAAHSHGDESWEPSDGLQRNSFTAAFNIIDWIGFGLILNAIFVIIRRPENIRDGLLWGLAGFAAVVVAPSLGLPPELPGIPAAELTPRQIWWIGTALATAVSLGLVAFVRKPWVLVVAIVLLAAPHLIGAPQLEHIETNVPEMLSHKFTVAVTLTTLLSWSLLGVLTAFFYRRFAAADRS